MDNQQFYVVYDVLREGYGTAPFLMSGAVLVITFVLFFQIVSLFKKAASQREWREYFALLIIPIVLAGFVFGTVNTIRVRYECLYWAKNGGFSVVQGNIRIGEQTSKRTEFSVRGVDFSLSKNDLTKCGCKSVIVADGSLVRISYREGQILKFEVAN